MNSEWKKKTWSDDFLRKNSSSHQMSIVAWLQAVGVIPHNVNWKRAAMSVYNGLDRSAIKGQVLAELAYEFDSEGIGSPKEFLEWIEFEMKDNPKRNEFLSILSSLGKAV